MLMAERRHLVPCLGENPRKLLLIGLSAELAEIVLEEDDAHDVLQQLCLGIGLHAFLADERANAPDVVGGVSGRRHDLPYAPGVKLLEIIAPAQITGATLRVA